MTPYGFFNCKSFCARLVVGNVGRRQFFRMLRFSPGEVFVHSSVTQWILSVDTVVIKQAQSDIIADTPRMRQFLTTQFQPYTISKNKYIWNNNIFYQHAESFLAVWKRNDRQVVKGYCWEITLTAWRSCCFQSRSVVLDFGLQLYSAVYTCTSDHVYKQFRLAQNSTCCIPADRI